MVATTLRAAAGGTVVVVQGRREKGGGMERCTKLMTCAKSSSSGTMLAADAQQAICYNYVVTYVPGDGWRQGLTPQTLYSTRNDELQRGVGESFFAPLVTFGMDRSFG